MKLLKTYVACLLKLGQRYKTLIGLRWSLREVENQTRTVEIGLRTIEVTNHKQLGYARGAIASIETALEFEKRQARLLMHYCFDLRRVLLSSVPASLLPVWPIRNTRQR